MKKLLSLILALVLALGCFIPAFAAEDPYTGSTTITATVAKPELEYEIVIPQAVTMNAAGVVEIGAAKIDTAEGKLKNATANTVISYTASGTDFTLKDGDATMPARYYSEYTKDGDQLISYTELVTTESFVVYKNSALVNPLTKLYVGVTQAAWDAAAATAPGTYTASVTYNFSAEEVESYRPATEVDGYYIVGKINGVEYWSVESLTTEMLLTENAGEYTIDWTFVDGDAIKVAKVEGGVISAWYKDGQDNEYKITSDNGRTGPGTLHFRPEGNVEWSYNYLTVIPASKD